MLTVLPHTACSSLLPTAVPPAGVGQFVGEMTSGLEAMQQRLGPDSPLIAAALRCVLGCGRGGGGGVCGHLVLRIYFHAAGAGLGPSHSPLSVHALSVVCAGSSSSSPALSEGLLLPGS